MAGGTSAIGETLAASFYNTDMTPIYEKDGLEFFTESKGADAILGDRLIINPNKLQAICSYIRQNNIKSITINPSYHQVQDLHFLSEIPSIKGLYILQDNLDLSPLRHLHSLRVLRLGQPNSILDLTNFKTLEVLGITYNKNVKNIDKAKNLYWLWLDNFNGMDLTLLSGLSNLKYLHLHKTKIESLDGIENLKELMELHIDTATQLQTLKGLSPNNKKLLFIDINKAKTLTDYSPLSFVSNLNKVWFVKTGDMTSLSIIKNLHKLKWATIGCKVIDGDMSFFNTVDGGGFVDFPHYNLKMKNLRLNKTSS